MLYAVFRAMRCMCMTVWPTTQPTWETPQRRISASAACLLDTTTLSLCRRAACSTVSCVGNLHSCSITSWQQVLKHTHTHTHTLKKDAYQKQHKLKRILHVFLLPLYILLFTVQEPVTPPVGRATPGTWRPWWSQSSSCCCSECVGDWWCSTSDTADCRTISLPLQTPTITLAWALPSSPLGMNWVRDFSYFLLP